ncbi:CPBP family intramembrane glutamic endopeptidase [Lentibacillus salicampi]|uniref:CPBP family intramembrane glutamic endopeptidase n=1 Tax=Lentibacillus salicampi TaxID=175306 RepID=UPI00142F8993|nr:CPBP family intramembrane glutamic endopeptidase [Lentibacillus salicampi]
MTAITSAGIKIVVWVLPVLWLVTAVEKRNPLTYLGLSVNVSKGLKWAGWFTLALAVCFLMANVLILGNGINLDLGFDEWLNTIIIVGITEEIVFRGFILNKCMEMFNFWKANIITSLLFVSIHFPIWIYEGLFQFPYVIGTTVNVFVVGVLFGYVYKKSGSLWSVIIIHSMYNLFVTVFG